MGFSVNRLQVLLLAGMGLLLLATVGWVGYARYMARGFALTLPGKLGIDIQQQADGFTYSQSVQGKTVYTIHAAKAVQHSNGKWTLRDVAISLYGQKQDRVDKIRGAEFEYDQKGGEIRAAGEVEMDLAAAAKAGSEQHVIHLKTSGLEFEEKTHRASTAARIEFSSGRYKGYAVGASYQSDTDLIVLESGVVVDGVMGGRPVELEAGHAVLDERTNRADLTMARYRGTGNDGGEETVRAQRAVIQTDDQQNPLSMTGDGEVTLAGAGKGTVRADHATASFVQGRVDGAHLYGGVRYGLHEAGRDADGGADDARLSFDDAGRIAKVVATGSVRGEERTAKAGRALGAAAVEVGFVAEGEGPAVLREVNARGGAQVVLGEKVAAGARVSTLEGDWLKATFAAVGRVPQLRTVHGEGGTVVHRVDELARVEVSRGRVLDASFEPGVGDSAVVLKEARQVGGVELDRSWMARPASASVHQQGVADEAVYDGEKNIATLTGGARLWDATSSVEGRRIVWMEESGDATAEGGVRVVYSQTAAGTTPVAAGATVPEPVHVVGDRAVLHHDDGLAVFYGSPARMWQAGSQVEAAVLELNQDKKTVVAHGDGAGVKDAVHAVLVPVAKPGVAAVKSQGPVRVVSTRLVYTEGTREVELTGAVEVTAADGVMRADAATVYLQAAKAGAAVKGAAGAVVPGGQVERIVATGGIAVTQPGRTATGAKLVYTASDGAYVLTGTKAVPPTVVDEAQGTVTGETMRFKGGDNSVVVTGGGSQRRVRTVTKVPQR